MNRPNSKAELKFPERLGLFGQGAMGWNLLAIVFLFAGLLVAGLAVQEKLVSVPPVIGQLPAAASSSEDPGSFTRDQWTPFDQYAPIFAARDIFKTDEERTLEATQQAEYAANVPAGNWGDGYQLMGVIVDNDPRAIIKTLNPPGVQTLAVGDQFGGATLVGIDKDRAVFEYQTNRVELHFSENAAR